MPDQPPDASPSGGRSAGLVVLVGPPGCGKSTIATALAAEHGWRWHDHEADLIAEWGTVEAFRAHKDEILTAWWAGVRDDVLGSAAASAPPRVVESTGLSDAPYLDALLAELAAAQVPSTVVVLTADRDEAARRLRVRPAGHHLTDDVEAALAVHDVVMAAVVGVRDAALTLDTATTPVADAIAAVVAAHGT